MIENEGITPTPDPTPTPTPTPTPPVKKIIRTRNLPNKDLALEVVSQNVEESWLTNTQITLIYMTQAQFSDNVTNYSDILHDRTTLAGTRPEVTSALKTWDKTLNDATLIVKGYINDKFTKKASKSYYKEFGIVKVGKGYKLPVDRDERNIALPMMLNAIIANGMQNNNFGKTFWENAVAKYSDLVTKAGSIDGNVSQDVGSKNELKKQIKKALNSLRIVIKGNYPETYKSVLRAWGFQKEKY